MQIILLPPGNMSEIVQIRNISALKGLDHADNTDDLSDVWIVSNTFNPLTPVEITARRFWETPYH